jgi:hypothetical protein
MSTFPGTIDDLLLDVEETKGVFGSHLLNGLGTFSNSRVARED